MPSITNPSAMEPTPAIGPQLAQARAALSLSVEDVSHVTRIPARVITALEADDYGTFPSAAYARGFLAQYSGYLDVDATRALDVIQDAPNIPPAPAILDLPAVTAKKQSNGQTKPSHHWQSLIVILVTSALLYGVLILYRKLDDHLNETRRDAGRPGQAGAGTHLGAQQLPATSPDNPYAIQTKSARMEPEPPPRAIIVQEPPADPLKHVAGH